MSFRKRARRVALGGVLAVGVAAIGLGVGLGSGVIALVGLALTLPQTAAAVLDLRSARRPVTGGTERRRDLAQRMLAARRTEELTPSIPGGATIDLDYVAETELVTFRSQDDGVAGFDDLVAAVKDEGGPLVLVGAPGSGKSLTARRVVTTLLEEAAAGGGALAERFLLWRWDGTPLVDWLAQEWAGREYGMDAAEARRLVTDPSVVLVLDGLDEVSGARRQACVDAINALVDVHPAVRLVVCCRNREYQALAERIESRRVRRISSLTAGTVAAFLDSHAPSTWDRVRATLPTDPALQSLLSTPLFLVAALRAFRDDPAPLLVGTLAERQHVLWDGYVARMLAAGDQPAVPLEVRRRWLEDVAITMAASGTFELARVPRRLRAFMDNCVQRHLLRRSANGYQCIHRQLLGHLVARSSVSDESRPLLGRLLTPVASEASAWNRLAREALAAGYNGVATRLSRRALALEPGNAVFLGDLAFHLLVAGRIVEAVTLAQAAETADPADWRPPSTLAGALFILGDIGGSVAAWARASANGTQLADESFLAYALTLQGLRDEADAVLDRIRANGGDDARRMDRALALVALGRTGEAAGPLFPLFPLFIERFNAALLLFDVPATVARSLIPCDMFEIDERRPGVARLAVVAVDHRQNPWGAYDEFVFALLVRPAGSPPDAGAVGGFIFRRSVNRMIGYGGAHVTVALANTAAEIDVAYTSDEVAFDLRTDGHETLGLRVPRVPAPSTTETIETTTYSVRGGMPYATREVVDLPPGVVTNTADVHVELGTGPLADVLRVLGLPSTPTFCAWGEDLSLSRHLPRPIRAQSAAASRRRAAGQQ